MVVVFYIGLANDLRLCKFQFMVAGPDRRDFAHKTCETFSLRTVLPCYRTLVLSLSLFLSLPVFLRPLLWSRGSTYVHRDYRLRLLLLSLCVLQNFVTTRSIADVVVALI